MTNEQIIFNERCRLMKEGILKGTGRTIVLLDENGKEFTLEEPQEMHTFQAWKAMGYTVKKGEKAIAKLLIWKYSKKAKKEEEKTGNALMDADVENIFMKTAHFFSCEQVEKLRG